MKSALLLSLAIAFCIFQVAWFGHFCFHQIDYDGISYLGVARHLRAGDFRGSLNAFRSPFFSWFIAAGCWIWNQPLFIGKSLTVVCYLLCLLLTWLLTFELWHSPWAAAIACIAFSLARAMAVMPVELVSPDFLLAALTALYFLVLLRCMRGSSRWGTLGIIHGVAFLAKAIALPWLALISIGTVLMKRREIGRRLLLTLTAPAVIACAWSLCLYSKYGVFTTGNQFKANLMQWTLHVPEPEGGMLTDTRARFDKFMTDDPMPPNSWGWTYRIHWTAAAGKIISRELTNLPRASKEILILVSPAAFLAVFLVAGSLAKSSSEFQFVAVMCAASILLMGAYCMLVFDERYVLPLVPLWLAVSAGCFAVPINEGWKAVVVALFLVSSGFTLLYHASPFHVIRRDFQDSIYDAAAKIPRDARLVNIGDGPFQEHGVGWEAGYKAAFFADARLVGISEKLPDDASNLSLAAHALGAEGIVIWGDPSNNQYRRLLKGLSQGASEEKIVDPVRGEVGTIVMMQR